MRKKAIRCGDIPTKFLKLLTL